MTIYEQQYRAVDSLQLEAVDAGSDGESLTWDEETLVTIDNQPWIDAFDTDRFHKAEYVVTQPAEQPYFVDGQQYTFTKPRDELKEAQWRLDNLPWTIEHPPEKRVVEIDEARGFWRGPYYDEGVDEQRAHLYVPANDDEALQYAAEHDGVSVGFTHGLARVDEYDGTIGGDVTLDNVDALQTDLYYDHVATVESPRLPDSGRVAGDALPADIGDDQLVAADSAGAGIAAADAVSSVTTPHVDERAQLEIETQVTDGSEVVVSKALASQPYMVAIHVRGDEHQYFSPSLSSALGTSRRFNANQLVEDVRIQLDDPLAADTEVFATLVTRRQRNGGTHVLGPKGWIVDSASVVIDSSVTDAATTQTKRDGDAPRGIYVADDGTWLAVAPSEHTKDSTEHADDAMFPVDSCGDVDDAWQLRGHTDNIEISKETLGDRIQRVAEAKTCDLTLEDTETDSLITMTEDFDIDNLTVDTIAEQHDGVADLVEQKGSLETEVDELEEQRDALQEELEETREELDDLKDKERQRAIDERVERLIDLTERWSEDDLREMDVDSHEEHVQRLDERIAIYKDMTDESTPTADEGGASNDGGEDDEYATGDVLDLSNTA
jgi:hypothetical protein